MTSITRTCISLSWASCLKVGSDGSSWIWATVGNQVNKPRERFGISRVALMGDRGILPQMLIEKLKAYALLRWIARDSRSGARKRRLLYPYLGQLQRLTPTRGQRSGHYPQDSGTRSAVRFGKDIQLESQSQG